MPNKQSHLKARFSLDDSMFQKGINALGAGVNRARSMMLGAGKVALGLAVSVGLAAAALSSPIGKAAAFEDAVIGFEQLLGGAEAAKKRIQELSQFAATTPFELPQVIQASRVLETLTKGALSTGKGLRMVGDAAAAVDQPVEELAVWFGRLYDGLQSGRPVGEALMRLQELGLVSGDVRGQLEKLQKQGIRGAEAWAVVTKSMERFSGLMEKRSASWNGKMSNLSDAWGQVLTRFGMPIKEALTPALDILVKSVGMLNDSAEAWGQGLVNAAIEFSQYVFAWLAAFTSIPNYFKMAGAVWKVVLLEGLVLARDGISSVLGLLAEGFDTVLRAGFTQTLLEGVKLVGVAIEGVMGRAAANLWDGLKRTVAGFWAAMETGVGQMTQTLLTGLLKVVGFFSEGWTKVFFSPLQNLGSMLARVVEGFGAGLSSALSRNWGAMNEALAKLRKPVDENEYKGARVETMPYLQKLAREFKADSFEKNFADAMSKLNAADPLKAMFDKLGDTADKQLEESLAGLKDMGGKVWEAFQRVFHVDKGLTGARDAAIEDLRTVIDDLAPEGKKAVVDAVGRMFARVGGASGPVGASGARLPGSIFRGNLPEFKSSFAFKGKDPRTSLFKTPGVGGSLLDLQPAGGLVTGGLSSGTLVNPGQRKAEEARLAAEKKAAEDKKSAGATEGTAADILKSLQDLLTLNKDVWQKKGT